MNTCKDVNNDADNSDKIANIKADIKRIEKQIKQSPKTSHDMSDEVQASMNFFMNTNYRLLPSNKLEKNLVRNDRVSKYGDYQPS